MSRVLLTTAEAIDFSDLLAAKCIARADELAPVEIEATCVILAARLSRYLYEQRSRRDEREDLRDPCALCEGMLLEYRVRFDWSRGSGVIVPCWACRPKAFCEFYARQAEHFEPGTDGQFTNGGRDAPAVRLEAERGVSPSGLRPRSDEEPCPPTLRSGYRDADPWELASEELNETAPLPREAPAYWGRVRDDADLNDDKSDLVPHTVTTTYPRGER